MKRDAGADVDAGGRGTRDALGALVPGAPAVARGEGDGGPLSGIRLVAKDVLDVAGTVTGAGNPDWAAGRSRASRHAAAVATLLGAGAELAGKGQCAELAYSLSGDNVHYGMPTNSAAPAHDPGGSTSGPAAAVAGGLCDLGIGTDTLGSTRIPASYCGLYGYRPTHGVISTTGVLPLAQRFDTLGLLASDPVALRRAAEVLLGNRSTEGKDPPRRLLIATDGLRCADPDVAEAVRGAAERLGRDLEAPLEDKVLLQGGGPDLPAAMEAFSVLQGAQVWKNFGKWVEATHPSLGADVAARIEGAARVTAPDVARAEPVAASVAARVRRLSGTEALVIPAAGTIAPPRDADPDTRQAARIAAGRLSCVASLAGAPAVSLPLAKVGALPVGLSLVAPPGSDHALLAAATRAAG
jgi:amidase